MADEGRAARLADRIKVIVAQMLEQRVKDPRLGFITITDVRVTGDLREATVFYTVYGDDDAWADTAAALKSVTGLLRTEVGKRTGVKFTPTLAFQPDAVPETARSIDELLARAAAADAHVHEIAEHGIYAGDADPYRHPHDDDEEDDEEGGGNDGDGESHGQHGENGAGDDDRV